MTSQNLAYLTSKLIQRSPADVFRGERIQRFALFCSILLSSTSVQAAPHQSFNFWNHTLHPNFIQASGQVLPVLFPVLPTVHMATTSVVVRYLVYTETISPEVLAQVRTLDTDAGYGELDGTRVIQAGLFVDQRDADRRLAQLAEIGIQAEILQVQVYPSDSESPETSELSAEMPSEIASEMSAESPSEMPSESLSESGTVAPLALQADAYYVIVPGEPSELATMMVNLSSLIEYGSIILRNHALGTHLAIGPFSQRADAQQLEDLLRDRHVYNARVYYERGSSLF